MKILTSSSMLLLSLAVVACGGSTTGGDRERYEAPQAADSPTSTTTPTTTTPTTTTPTTTTPTTTTPTTTTPTTPTTTTPTATEVPSVITVSASDPSASNEHNGALVSEGGTGPLRTLQAALDRVTAGGRIRVIGGDEIYSSNPNDESDIQGFVLNTSGTFNNPIIIEGIADAEGNLPIIDQARESVAETSFLGLVLNCVSHIEVSNFEIRRVNDAGVSSSLSGCETQNVKIHNMNIHHVHGLQNTAAIRLVGVSNAEIHNNQITSIFEYEADTVSEPAVADETGSGIVRDINIAHNTIHNLDNGISLIARQAGLLAGIEIANNEMRALSTGIGLQVNQEGAGTFEKVFIHHNISNGVEQFLSVEHQFAEQSLNLLSVANNTVINTTLPALELSGVDGASIYNNLFVNLGAEVILHHRVANAEMEQSISIFDHNGYWGSEELVWTLNQGEFQNDSRGMTLTGLENWQQAEHALLEGNPATASWEEDPRFTNPEEGDFTLLTDSPALNAGRNGEAMGALSLWSDEL